MSKIKAKSVIRKRACIIAFFKYLLEDGEITKSPCDSLPKVKSKSTFERQSLNELELSDFIEKCYRYAKESTSRSRIDNCTTNAKIVELLSLTGLRISELCSLTSENLDFESSRIRVIGKGGKLRYVFMSKRAESILKGFVKPRVKTLFVNRKGNPHTDQDIRFFMKNVCVKYGLSSKYTPHSMRHSFASILIAKGVPVPVVQELLGHEKITTTMIYVHNDESQLKNAVSLLGG